MGHLLRFLKDYLAWAEDGAPEDHYTFRRREGLCHNADMWDADNDIHFSKGASKQLNAMLVRDFPDNPGYPFGEAAYNDGADKGTLHRYSLRINWVRKTIRELDPDALPSPPSPPRRRWGALKGK